VRDLIPVWPLNEEIATDAVTAVEEHRLRAADAMHLATAQRISGVVSGARVVMVSSDRELLSAAEATGLAALDPQARGSAGHLRQLRQQ
jgi:predicted nucleic acid-binding protein